MNNETSHSRGPDQQGNKKSPLWPLLLAFLPAVMVLALWPPKPNIRREMYTVACSISVVCCFISSFMLFARRTGLAILAGVIFLLLNALIALFFGCVA